jgi:hypothetical protein
MKHELKIWTEYFNDVAKGEKSFEIRKDDRDYKVGDSLILLEISHTTELYTGCYTLKEITYVFGRNEEEKQFVKEGYVILGIKPLEDIAC